MSTHYDRLYATDETFRDVADLLFGGGGEVLAQNIAKAASAQSKEEKKQKRLQNIAIAGNAASTVAGPAAIYSAVRSARNNSGGIPRDIADAATGATRTKAGPDGKTTPNPTKFGQTKFGQKVASGVKTLNNKTGKKGKYGAAIAGGTLVGLQGINVGTDALSTKLLADQKKQNSVSKANPDSADISVPGGSLKQVFLVEGGKKISPHAKKRLKERMKKSFGPTLRPLSDEEYEQFAKAETVKSNDLDVVWEGEFSKVDSDKRQVFGWASIVKMNGEDVVDLQGDYISIDEVEKAGYDYVVKSRKGGNQHQRQGDGPLHVSDMIESFIVTPEKIEKMGLPDTTPLGWWVGYQINDDDTWQSVKDGKMTGFSIHGKGKRASA